MESVCNCQNNDSTTQFFAALAVNWVNNYDKSRVQLRLAACTHTHTNI